MRTYAEPPLTIADLEAAPDDGNRYELIEGELFVSAPPSIFHQSILLNVATAFKDYLRQHSVGRIHAGIGVIFDDLNGVIPDLVYVSNEKANQIVAGGRLIAAPEIVIEILSTGTSSYAFSERRDRHVKRNLYSVRGVHEYWIVDPESRSIEIHRKRKEGGLEVVANLQYGDDVASPILPDFRLAVELVLAE